MKNKSWITYGAALLSMIFWSFSFVWVKVVYEAYGPLTTVLFRLILSSGMLLAFTLITRKLQRIKPGDLKYVDQNNDNIIDEKDEVYLGRGGWYGTPLTVGVNLTLKYKNFSFFALGTGGFGGVAMKNSSYHWVYGNGKYSEIVRERWTEQTKETATFPRLTTQTGANNFRNSDFWLYKTDRFNIAKLQLTYDLPEEILVNSVIKGVSAYISGSNLLTIAKEKETMELSIGSAPQTRFYNVGVKVVF